MPDLDMNMSKKQPFSRSEEEMARKKQKHSVILLIASIIATACFIYIVSYMSNSAINASGSSAQATGVGIALAMATPSVIVSGIGTLFSWIGYFVKKRGFALAAGILFAVSMLLMIPWLMFNVVQMILCFVAFATMKKAG